MHFLFGCSPEPDLDGDALEQAFRRHAEGLLPAMEPGRMPVVALDGKTLKGSFDHLNDRKAAQALSDLHPV